MKIQKIEKVTINVRELDMTFSQLVQKFEWLKQKGFDFWIEGNGDGSQSLLFERTKTVKIANGKKTNTRRNRRS